MHRSPPKRLKSLLKSLLPTSLVKGTSLVNKTKMAHLSKTCPDLSVYRRHARRALVNWAIVSFGAGVITGIGVLTLFHLIQLSNKYNVETGSLTCTAKMSCQNTFLV